MEKNKPKLTQDRMVHKVLNKMLQNNEILALILKRKAEKTIDELSEEFDYEANHRTAIVNQAVKELLDLLGIESEK